MDEDEYGRTPWRLEATVTDPVGLRVHVTVTVPPGRMWNDKTAVGDCSEIAQMAANRAMTHINDIRRRAAEEVPF